MGISKEKKDQRSKEEDRFFDEAHADWQKFGEAGNSNFLRVFQNTKPFFVCFLGLDYPVLMRERDRRIELAEDGEGEEQEEELLCSCCCCCVVVGESEVERGSVLMMVATERTDEASRILCCCCCCCCGGGSLLITTPSILLIRLREAGR